MMKLNHIAKLAGASLICILLVISYFRLQTILTNTSQQDTEKIFTATVTNVISEENTQFDNRDYVTQLLEVDIESQEKKVEIETSLTPKYVETRFKESDKLLVGMLDTGVGDPNYYVIGYSRTTPLLVLTLLFVCAAIFVARKKGVYSLLGMIVSLTVLILFILPAISQGANPLLTSLFGAATLIPILFYISHGVNRKTTAAVIGTGITFVITAVLAQFFVNWAHLTGISFEEVETLLYIHDGNFDMQGILLAGILLGVLGVIDDVSMTQASVVEEIYRSDKKISNKELISKAMNVGKDHIGSVVNTLILVYVGGALTTLLLFTQFPRPFEVLINSEIVAIPIVVALIGSLGLIMAVPITTFIATWIVVKHTNGK